MWWGWDTAGARPLLILTWPQATPHPDGAPSQLRALAPPTASRQPPRGLQSPSTPSEHQSLPPEPPSKLSRSHLAGAAAAHLLPASPPPASFLFAWVSGQGWPYEAPGVSRRPGEPATQPPVRPGPRTRSRRPAGPTSQTPRRSPGYGLARGRVLHRQPRLPEDVDDGVVPQKVTCNTGDSVGQPQAGTPAAGTASGR